MNRCTTFLGLAMAVAALGVVAAVKVQVQRDQENAAYTGRAVGDAYTAGYNLALEEVPKVLKEAVMDICSSSHTLYLNGEKFYCAPVKEM